MTWLWKCRRRRADPEPVRVDSAQRRLDEAHEADPVVRSIVQKLAGFRERNNFASSIEAAFREHR